jgi:hypothetical protein
MHEIAAALAAYRQWRRALWPLERWAADLAVGITVLAIVLWVTKP